MILIDPTNNILVCPTTSKHATIYKKMLVTMQQVRFLSKKYEVANGIWHK